MDKEQSTKEQTPQNNNNNNNNNGQAVVNPKPKISVSAATKDRAEAAKAYIERKYAKAILEERKYKDNWQLLFKKMEALNLSQAEQELIKRDILFKDAELQRKKRQKTSAKDFEPLAIIGRGAFGEVRVCINKEQKEIVAVKKMKKQEMLNKNQIGHIRAERDILASFDNPWIVELFQSFQDEKYLYLVMEFLPGGDLMTVLMKKDILQEEEAKFYIAELIMAVDSVHKMNYIHRDLKPDNVLIGKDGHIKLSDFGLCKQTEIKPKVDLGRQKQAENIYANPALILTKKPQNFSRNRHLAFSTVGTPDYIAPEVFGQQGYTETVDWWSIGVILFEMLVGYPPFFSEDPSMTCQKILHWKRMFLIPPEANLSHSAADLIKRLIADQSERLGINGVEEIKAHPFFCGIDWKRLRERKAPYVPPVGHERDFQNFDAFKEETAWIEDDPTAKSKRIRKQDINFAGYSFNRNKEMERSQLTAALENLENNKQYLSSNYTRSGSAGINSNRSGNEFKDRPSTNHGDEKPSKIAVNNSNFQKSTSPLRQMSPINISNNAITGTGLGTGSGSPTNKSGNTYFLQQLGKNQFTNDASKFGIAQKSPREQTQNQLTSQAIKVPTSKGLNGVGGGGGLYSSQQQQNSSSTGNLKKTNNNTTNNNTNGLPNVGSGSPRGIDYRGMGMSNKGMGVSQNAQIGYNYMGSARNMSPNSQLNK